MRKKAALALALGLLCYCVASPAQEKNGIPLTMEEAIVQALKSNLNLAVEVIGPEIASSNIDRAREIFIPQLGFDFGTERQESPSTWWLQGSGTTVSKNLNYGATLTGQLPTGGSLALSMANYRYETNQLFQLFNPYYRSSLSISFNQPLLRNFGPKIAGREILIAKQGYIQSEAQLRQAMMNVVYQVEEAYWRLVFAVENLKVSRQSLDLARELLTKTKREADVGQTAPIEVLNAEATVAQREADIIQAEAQVDRSDELLRALLDLRPEEAGAGVAVSPVDKPVMIPLKVTYDELMEKALINRPELQTARSMIETRKIDFTVAKNRLLPNLDLELLYYSPGIAGDKLIYQNDDPFTGIVIGKEEGTPWDAVRDSVKFLYNNWTVSLNLSIPFADLFSKAGYTAARLDVDRSQAQLKLQEQQISLEISDAVRSLETDAKRVEAYRIARELAEKRLEAETKKLGVGLTTNYFVLEYQERLANARSAEISALVDYNISLARVEKASGEILRNHNINIR